jgi:Holliday junction resolvase
MTEAQLQQKVEAFLKEKNIWFVKYWGGGQFTKAGVPDILACVEGSFLGVELKTEVGRVSELQKYNLKKITECGGISIVLRPSGLDDFKDFIVQLQERLG